LSLTNHCHWTRNPERKVKQRNELYCLARKWSFVFSAIITTMRLLNIDAKKWSMDRGPGPINP
jgi:hypothetical protein